MIGYAKHFLRGRQAYAVGASVLRQKSHLLKLTHNGKLFFIVQFAYAPFFCSFEQPLTHEHYSHYKPSNTTQRADLLFINGNHFERLELIQSENSLSQKDVQSHKDEVFPDMSIPVRRKGQRKKLFKTSKDEQTRIQLSLETVKLSGYVLSDTLGEGDCFFDACAQALTTIGKIQANNEPYDVKSLRCVCHNYVLELDKSMNISIGTIVILALFQLFLIFINYLYAAIFHNFTSYNSLITNKYKRRINKKENWIYQELKSDEQYYHYLTAIGFTAEEAEEEKNHWATKGLATWGQLSIDGRIICEQLGVTIHWIKILEEDEVKQAGTQILHQLQRPNGSKAICLEHQFEINYQDEMLAHLVVYKNHVVPLLKFPIFSEQQSHHQVSKNKPLSLSNVDMAYTYQLLRSMTKDALVTKRPMSDSNRLRKQLNS